MVSKIKALLLNKPNEFKYIEKDVEDLKEGEVLLKIVKLGICGSDIHAYGGKQAFFNYPKIIGHEICARVYKIAKNSSFNVGESVTVMPYFACKACVACRSGKENCCENLQVVGVHIDGAAAEYLVLPEEYVIPIKNMEDDNCVLIEPLAISTHAVKRAEVKKGQKALVIGLGAIGLGVAAVLKNDGIETLGLDINSARVKLLNEKLNIPALNAADENIQDKVYSHFGGEYPILVFDATGNKASMESAVKFLAHGGKMIFVGIHKGILELDDVEFHKRETTILRSRAATREDFQYVIKSIINKKINPKEFLISHRVKFEDIENEFVSIINNPDLIKCIVDFEEVDHENSSH